MAELDQTQTYQITDKAKPVAVDAKAERQHLKDLETIRLYAPSPIESPMKMVLESEYAFRTATSDPIKAHAIATMVSTETFKNLDHTIKDLVYTLALSLGQNWTRDSVVKLKNLVTSGSFASSSPEDQAEMLNKFQDDLFKSKKT